MQVSLKPFKTRSNPEEKADISVLFTTKLKIVLKSGEPIVDKH